MGSLSISFFLSLFNLFLRGFVLSIVRGLLLPWLNLFLGGIFFFLFGSYCEWLYSWFLSQKSCYWHRKCNWYFHVSFVSWNLIKFIYHFLIVRTGSKNLIGRQSGTSTATIQCRKYLMGQTALWSSMWRSTVNNWTGRYMITECLTLIG